MSAISLANVYRARRRLAGRVVRTPLIESVSLSAIFGAPVYLKLETVQPTGSFKVRGATNALAVLAERSCRAVVTASTGNHGRAIAYAARALGMQATVCMSSLVPANKVDAVRALGAEVRIVGDSQDDAQADALSLAQAGTYAFVPPFDDPDVIAGQATIGVEIVEDLPDVAHIVVPLSGGGLFSGIALAAKAASPAIRMSGVTMRRGAAMHASLRAGKPVQVDEVPTLADSLGGGIGLDNRFTFALTHELIDDVLLLDEDAIECGIVHAYRHEKLVLEGAGAVGIAAVLEGMFGPLPVRGGVREPASPEASSTRSMAHASSQSGPVVLVISGCNIDADVHRRIVASAHAH
jgi:threonine dehydratase